MEAYSSTWRSKDVNNKILISKTCARSIFNMISDGKTEVDHRKRYNEELFYY